MVDTWERCLQAARGRRTQSERETRRAALKFTTYPYCNEDRRGADGGEMGLGSVSILIWAFHNDVEVEAECN
jgi:hypothetical protein